MNARPRCLLVVIGAITLAGSAANAQHASQVVRFSVMGATQGSISSGPGAEAGGGSSSSSASTGFSTSPASAPSRSSASTPQLAQSQLPPKTRVDSTGKTTFVQQEVSVPVWQASIAVSNSEDNMKVAVSLDSPMPEGVDLTLEMGASHGAETSGMVVLGTGGTDAMTSMPKGSSPSIPVGFGIAGASSNAGPRKVNFTLIAGA